MEESLFDYQVEVHKSLLHPIQFMGIGELAFVLIMMVTTVLATLVSVWCIIGGVVAFAAVRFMCKGEPYLVNFVVENLGQSEVYHG